MRPTASEFDLLDNNNLISTSGSSKKTI